MAVKVGINGFGRIGRNILRASLKDTDIEFVAVNDLADAATLGHLVKYDSVMGTLDENVKCDKKTIHVADRSIQVLSERDPAALPWGKLGVQVVVEATGLFRDRDSAAKHLTAGAKKVIITAPAKGEDLTVVLGVNDAAYDPATHHVVSNASCTTNCLAPVAKVLLDNFGIERGLMTTIHAYTNDQVILDFPHSDLRRARAAGLSMIPTTTGAAVAVGKVLPQLKGKLNGMAIRVPTPNVSVVDLVVEVSKPASKDALADAFRTAVKGDLGRYLEYCEEPLVSRDFNGCAKSAIVDALSTYIIDDKLVKVLAWYDNEWAYSCRVRDLIKLMAEKGL